MDKELITAQALAEALDLSVETIWRIPERIKYPTSNWVTDNTGTN